MKNIRFGLKFKILLGIVSILLICTSFNIFYSYDLFVEDKSSYIYESGLKRSENISDQLKFKIEDAKTIAEFNYLLFASENVDFDKIINTQADNVVAGMIDTSNDDFKVVNSFLNFKQINTISDKYSITSKSFFEEIKKRLAKKKDIKNNQFWIYTPKANAHFLIYLLATSKKDNLFFTVTNLSTIYELFESDQTYFNQVISLDNPKEVAVISEWIGKINFATGKKGTLKVDVKERSKLLSYSFVTEKILVTSFIDEEDAFIVTKTLVLKTSLFAGFLLSISLIIGIYFSSSITYPLKKLTAKAQDIASGDFSSNVEVNTTDEIALLGYSFNFMTKEIRELLKNKEVLIAKLEDYSKNLEKMVEKRTIELKEAHDFMALMINSLDQGLVVFDKNLRCHPMFTKACEPIFGISPRNRTIPDILDIKDETNIQSLKQWTNVLFNEMIPFESAVDLGPRQKTIGADYHDPNFKFVQIEYYPMRDSEEKIANVVMIATDKTNEVQARETAKEKEQYVSMILKILNNKTQFESFINEVEEIFSQFGATYSEQSGTINFELAMMLFHTLNGGFGIYSISKLQTMARGYEQEISINKDSCPSIPDFIRTMKSFVEKLQSEFHAFKLELDSLIGTKFATNQSFTEVPREKILELRELINENHNHQLTHFYVENFIKVPIINYFKAYDDLCRTTAAKINKEFKGLIFHNEYLKIEAEPLLEFFNVLVHLFRNCLDHGIEDSYTRQNAGKSPDGHIGVNFEIKNIKGHDVLIVVVQDDGAGINPEIIRKRYNKLRPEENIDDINDEDIIYKIFDPFFSTRDEVSALSGRGVGMSAIKDVVDRMNGKIIIESTVGKGSVFSFLLPLS